MRVLLLALTVSAWGAPLSAQEGSRLQEVRALRLSGDLEEARELALRELAQGSPGVDAQVGLRIELARIHDRVGLHNNTRPVAAALHQIEAAEALSPPQGSLSEARLEMARAEYFYRAEMAEREFPTALRHARKARTLFQVLGDLHGEAEAVHRLGLIRMQRRELEEARRLFDLSLELDRQGGQRTFFRGEYERHVAFVLLLGGETAEAIPYFKRSLQFRRQAGAIDASLFAALSLASALIQVGRTEEAEGPLLYAALVAERLGSPVGKARNGYLLGQFYSARGDRQAARLAFQAALQAAEEIDYGSLASQVRGALESLQENP